MLALLRPVWALLLGIVLLMAGNGLLSSLLGLRGSIEGFSSTVMGGLMSGYYIGFLASSLLTPRGVRSVGHIRIFAALAAMATVAAILAALFVYPAVWLLSRIISGFCYAGLYVVAESWINDRSSNETRGRLFSVYMLTQYAGLIGGQGLLNLFSPAGFESFSLVALLISVAVVPTLLTAKQAPAVAAPRHVGLRQLYRISPLGTIGTLAIGMAQSAFFSMGAIFGHRIGLSTEQVSLFLIAAILGGATLQWPVGRLSDKFDRRRLLTVAAFASTVLAVVAMFAASFSLPVLIIAASSSPAPPCRSIPLRRPYQRLETGADGGGERHADPALRHRRHRGSSPMALMEWLGPRAYWGYLAVGFRSCALRALPDDAASLAVTTEAQTKVVAVRRKMPRRGGVRRRRLTARTHPKPARISPASN
jgi:MFS family permease